MATTPHDIIMMLRASPGLNVLGVVDDALKQSIREREEKSNTGVFACLDKPVTIAVSHDSTFRLPVSEIVHHTAQGTLFPPVSFPEIPGALSSSPSLPIHELLTKRLNVTLEKDDATLLIGVP